MVSLASPGGSSSNLSKESGGYGADNGIIRLHDDTVHIVTDSLDVIPPPLTLTLTLTLTLGSLIQLSAPLAPH